MERKFSELSGAFDGDAAPADSVEKLTMTGTQLAIDHTTTAQSAALNFFNLPRKLRDAVYDLVWLTTPKICQRYANRSYILTYCVSPDNFAELEDLPVKRATWLLANKQIMTGLQQLQQDLT